MIKNSQRTIPIDIKALEKDVRKILKLVGYSGFDLGIWLTSDATMRKYNRIYRNKDRVTDVLSFPFYPDLKPGQSLTSKTADDQNLGDLIFAPAYIKKMAEKLHIPFHERMLILLVHGICHLLGYDHIKDADYRIMFKKEQEILEYFGIELPF